MWETLRNNADWDCFKTPILQEILRIQNRHQVVRCPFLEVIRLFHSLGCARNKLQFRTVQKNQKSFLRMQDWRWTVSPHLMYGIWSSQFLETRIRVIKNGRLVYEPTCSFVRHLTQFKNESNLRDWSMIWTMLTILSNVNSSHQEALLYVFEDNEAVINLFTKGRIPTMRHASWPQSCSWLVVW